MTYSQDMDPATVGWDAYKAALDAYRVEATPETMRKLINAYSDWGLAFGLSALELHIEVERFRRGLMREQRKRAA